MKNKIELILLLIIPIILFVVMGIAIMPEDITFDNVQKEKGEITDFYEGVNTRRIHKPMYIIINNDKYFMTNTLHIIFITLEKYRSIVLQFPLLAERIIISAKEIIEVFRKSKNRNTKTFFHKHDFCF